VETQVNDTLLISVCTGIGIGIVELPKHIWAFRVKLLKAINGDLDDLRLTLIRLAKSIRDTQKAAKEEPGLRKWSIGQLQHFHDCQTTLQLWYNFLTQYYGVKNGKTNKKPNHTKSGKHVRKHSLLGFTGCVIPTNPTAGKKRGIPGPKIHDSISI
jgi:hypothetical protein